MFTPYDRKQQARDYARREQKRAAENPGLSLSHVVARHAPQMVHTLAQIRSIPTTFPEDDR